MKTPIYTGIFQSDLDATGFKLLNLPTPTLSGDAATKGYVDAHAGGGGGGGSNPLITVNVKDAPYSAVGDGVTDDSVAINAAILAVFNLGGGTVFFPKGIYLCNGAFDATTNSVLRIPQVPIQTSGAYNYPVTVQLLGETPSVPAATSLTGGSRIKCIKTGTGTAPAILAGNAYWGRSSMGGSYLTAMSYTQVIVRNLSFDVSADPSIYGIRLDAVVFAVVEDVVILSPNPPFTQPTHSTVGLWMPVSQNFGTSYCNRVAIAGFDTGLIVSEHFSCPSLMVFSCRVGIEFIFGNHLSWIGRVHAMMCNTAVAFTNQCFVIVNINIEQANAGWEVPGTDLDDTSNYACGEIRYSCKQIGGVFHPPTVSGGNKLILTDLNTGSVRISPSGTLSIGTDLRMVTLTGGGKLQARNTGTNTWADVDQWTNP